MILSSRFTSNRCLFSASSVSHATKAAFSQGPSYSGPVLFKTPPPKARSNAANNNKKIEPLQKWVPNHRGPTFFPLRQFETHPIHSPIKSSLAKYSSYCSSSDLSTASERNRNSISRFQNIHSRLFSSTRGSRKEDEQEKAREDGENRGDESRRPEATLGKESRKPSSIFWPLLNVVAIVAVGTALGMVWKDNDETSEHLLALMLSDDNAFISNANCFAVALAIDFLRGNSAAAAAAAAAGKENAVVDGPQGRSDKEADSPLAQYFGFVKDPKSIRAYSDRVFSEVEIEHYVLPAIHRREFNPDNGFLGPEIRQTRSLDSVHRARLISYFSFVNEETEAVAVARVSLLTNENPLDMDFYFEKIELVHPQVLRQESPELAEFLLGLPGSPETQPTNSKRKKSLLSLAMRNAPSTSSASQDIKSIASLPEGQRPAKLNLGWSKPVQFKIPGGITKIDSVYHSSSFLDDWSMIMNFDRARIDMEAAGLLPPDTPSFSPLRRFSSSSAASSK